MSEENDNQIDTRNDFFVGVQGDTIRVLKPTPQMTREQALRMAAWIVSLLDAREEFDRVYNAVINT